MRAIVTASPAFASIALGEIEASLPPGAAIQRLQTGVWLVAAAGRFGDVTFQLGRTVFVRHASPVDVEVARPADDPEAFVRSLLPALAVGRLPSALQVQTRVLQDAPRWRPGLLAAAIRAGLAQGGVDAGTGPLPWVLSVVVGNDHAYAGVARRDECLSPWPGGEARFRRPHDEVSRSARKLEEALGTFGIATSPGQRALDLGAAPGGWSQFLVGLGMRVTAIDTGRLDPRVAGHPALTYIRGSAVRLPVPSGPFRLLCADLNWDPVRAAQCTLRYRPALAPGADGIHTIKFFGTDPLRTVAAVREVLSGGYSVAAVRHLFHNRDEATAHLRTPTGSAASA